MAIGGIVYWLVVGALVVAVGTGHSLYVRRLEAKGYWVPNGDGLLMPMIVVVVLAATVVAAYFGE